MPVAKGPLGGSSDSSTLLRTNQVNGIGNGLESAEMKSFNKEPNSPSEELSNHLPPELAEQANHKAQMQQMQATRESVPRSKATTDRLEVTDMLNETEYLPDDDRPHLKPKDLEDAATIFDKLRLLHKKKEELANPMSKKLIAKNSGKGEDALAVEFDKQLTQMMGNLSNHLKDALLTPHQKWSKVENCKFDLLNYCSDVTSKFLAKYKTQLSLKEVKEVVVIQTKIKAGMAKCFANQGKLFQTRQEGEVYQTCAAQMQIMSRERAEALDQWK